MEIVAYIGFACLFLMVMGAGITFKVDWVRWNGGKCARCGVRWELLGEYDKDKNRDYACGCRKICIMWPIDRGI